MIAADTAPRRRLPQGRTFDVVVCDPPTFSRSKQRGDWRAEDGWVRRRSRVPRVCARKRRSRARRVGAE